MLVAHDRSLYYYFWRCNTYEVTYMYAVNGYPGDCRGVWVFFGMIEVLLAQCVLFNGRD